MKYDIMQDLVIVGGGALLMVGGVVSKEPINIFISGLLMLFGIATLYADTRRG